MRVLCLALHHRTRNRGRIGVSQHLGTYVVRCAANSGSQKYRGAARWTMANQMARIRSSHFQQRRPHSPQRCRHAQQPPGRMVVISGALSPGIIISRFIWRQPSRASPMGRQDRSSAYHSLKGHIAAALVPLSRMHFAGYGMERLCPVCISASSHHATCAWRHRAAGVCAVFLGAYISRIVLIKRSICDGVSSVSISIARAALIYRASAL